MPGLSKEQKRFLERAALQYAGHLDDAAEWLAARGLELEFARSRGLGVVRDPLPGHEDLAGRLMIPYLTDVGPVNMTFRCMESHDCKAVPDHAKYKKPKGLSSNIYGVQSFGWADDWVVVTEGEIDALTWQQIGVPAVGVPGAENWQPYWANVFEDFARVYVAQDGDAAGKDLWYNVSDNVTGAIKIRMPDGEDSNSMFLKAGEQYLLGRIRK